MAFFVLLLVFAPYSKTNYCTNTSLYRSLAIILVILSAAVVSSEGVSLVADNITVALGDPALLNCTLSSYSDGAGAVSIIISKITGSFSPDK